MGGAFRPRPSVTFIGYFVFVLTVIVLGFTSSDFGKVIVRIPFSKSAFALSAFTVVGSMTERSNAPQRCSRMCQAFSFFSSSCFVSPLMVRMSPVMLIWTSSALMPGMAAFTTTSLSVWYMSIAKEDQLEPPSLVRENGRVNASSKRRSIASRKVIISRPGSQRVRLDITTSLFYFLRLPLCRLVQRIFDSCMLDMHAAPYKALNSINQGC